MTVEIIHPPHKQNVDIKGLGCLLSWCLFVYQGRDKQEVTPSLTRYTYYHQIC